MIARELKGRIGFPNEMKVVHLLRVVEIERQSAQDQSNEKNGGVIPWDEYDFAHYMGKGRRCQTMVFTHDKYVAGFIVTRGLEILRMAVRRECRRRGVGTRMLDWAKEKLWAQGKIMSIYVRETNLAGLRFLHPVEEKFGNDFHAAGIKPDFFKRQDPENPKQKIPAEDAILMQYGGVIPPLPIPLSRLARFG